MRLTLLFIIFLSFSVLAQDNVSGTSEAVAQTTQQELETRNDEVSNTGKMYLMIRPFICPSHLPTAVCQQISRILIQTASKQTVYQIMLTPLGDYTIRKGIYHEVDLKVDKFTGTLYEINATLKNLKKEKILKTVGKQNVNQGNLIHNIDLAIELLFADLPSLIEEDSKPAPPPVKKVMTLKDKINLQARESPVDDKGLDAFKKRIMKIKSGLEVKAEEVAERIEEENEKDKKNQKKSKLNPNPIVNLSQDSIPSNPNKKGSALVWFQNAFIGYRKRNLVSTETLTNNFAFRVKTDLSYIWAYYGRGLYLGSAKKHQIDTRLVYGKLNNAPENIELPSYYSIQLNYGYDFKDPRLLTKIGVYLEPIDFVSLPDIGGGLKPGRIQATWIPISGRIENEIWNREVYWTFFYHHLVSGKSSYATIKQASYSGNKIGSNVEVLNVWKKFSLSVNLELLSVDAKGERAVNLKGSTYQIGTVYKF